MKQQFQGQVKSIILDLGGVILDIDYTLTIDAFKNLGIQDFQNLYAQASQSGVFDDFETGKISEKNFIEYLLRAIPNPRCSSEEVIQAWNAMLLNWDQRKLDLIQDLRKNYTVFLLSNTNSIHQKAFTASLNEQLGISTLNNHFDRVYLSHEIGLRKPNKEVFEFVLHNEGLTAEKTLFIDDSIQHLEGAKSLGIQTQLIDPSITLLQFFS